MKKFVSIAFALILCFSLSTVALAYVTFGGILTRGVTDLQYYVDTSASTYSSLITTAAANWKSASGNFINLTKNSSFINTGMDFYGENVTEGEAMNWVAWTEREDFDGDDWAFGAVFLNEPWYINLGTTVFKGSIAHEMGHVMGLDENNSMKNTIMCQHLQGRTVNIPQKDDVNGIKSLYGGRK